MLTASLAVLSAYEKIFGDTWLQNQVRDLLMRKTDWLEPNFAEELNSNTRLIPFQCGTVFDVKGMRARALTPEDRVSMTFGMKWEDVPAVPTADFYAWHTCMFTDHLEGIYIMTIHALALVGAHGLQFAAFCNGPSKNGKS